MKKNIKTFVAAGLAVLATGCTDLDVKVDSLYTTAPGSEAAVEANMADIYFQMRGPFGRRYMEAMALSSDEWTSVAYGGGWVDGGAYAHPSLHAYSKEDATIDWMGELGKGIVKANEVIDSETADEKYKVSARAMRAFFEFIMMDCWGDVPIVDHSRKDLDIELRQPRAEVAKYIESELLDIVPKLPTELNSDTYGKPTKYMAQALLAKLYINWPVYTADSVQNYDAATARNEKLQTCINVCNAIINSGKFNLGSMAYRFKFGPNNTALNVEDFIYVMPYDTYDATGMQYGRAKSYKDVKSLKPSYYGMNLANSGGAYMTLTPEFVRLFNLPGDERNLCIIGDTVHVYDPETLLPTSRVCLDRSGKPLVLHQDIKLDPMFDKSTIDVGDNLTGWSQGYRSVKWFVINDDYKNGRNQSNDLPIFRYADILLTKAEALVRSNGDQAEARKLFNQIRAYVHAPLLDHNPSLEEIYEERGREFFDENWRRNDMIRFGHFEDEYFPHYKDFPTARFDKTCRVFPIHRDMLNSNPRWKQNEGY